MNRRAGFTVVELLVVIAVIAMLVALLIPAVQAARESARRTSCMNRMRQLGLGLLNYESAVGHFPSSWLPSSPIYDGKTSGWSAQVQLLPYIEHNDIFQQIDLTQQYALAKLPDGTPVGSLRIAELICPAESGDRPRLSDGRPYHYPLNYVVNVGVWLVFDPTTGEGGRGAFYPGSKLTTSAFEDGMSKTVGFTEVKAWNPYYRNAGKFQPELPSAHTVCSMGGQFKMNSGHTEWVDGRVHQTGVTAAFPPNTKLSCAVEDETYDVDWTNQQEGISADIATYASVTARSYHGSGVNAVRMDASAQFVSNEISIDVWREWFTRR